MSPPPVTRSSLCSIIPRDTASLVIMILPLLRVLCILHLQSITAIAFIMPWSPNNNPYQTQQQQEGLLAPSTTAAGVRAKSPAWTIADLFAEPPALGIFYHLCGTSYDLCTPVGTIIGSTLAVPLFSSTPFLQVAGTGGLIGGGFGLVFGAAAYTSLSQGWMPPRDGTPPWNSQGILER